MLKKISAKWKRQMRECFFKQALARYAPGKQKDTYCIRAVNVLSHFIFTICVLFLVCYSILNASCKKLFAQLRYDLIDHLAVSLALQLWHNSLHDLSFVSRSDQVCMFLCKVSLDLRSVHQLWSVFRNHIISCLIFIFQILSGFGQVP